MKPKKFSASGFQKTEGMDTLAWHFEKNGLFSVRSAYKLAVELNSNDCSKAHLRIGGTLRQWGQPRYPRK
jgi:hypothetical protein